MRRDETLRTVFSTVGGAPVQPVRAPAPVVARELFSVELPLRGFSSTPTVAGLAELVEALRRADLPQMALIVAAGRGEPLPLSFAQERLRFLQRLQPGSSACNVFAVLRLRGALNTQALERPLGEGVRRHQVLRGRARQLLSTAADTRC